MDWFEKITGFIERDYDQVHDNISITDQNLFSKVNQKNYSIGCFECLFLKDLRNKTLNQIRTEEKSSCSIISKDNTAYNSKNVTRNIFSLFDLLSLQFGVNYSTVQDASDLKQMRGKCDFDISLAPYLILKRGYTYYNGRGFMPIQIDVDWNNRLQGEIQEYLRLGNIKLKDYIQYIRDDIPDTFDTTDNCKLFEKQSDNLEKNEAIKSVHKYRGRQSFRKSYSWVNQVKLYDTNKNKVSVLDTSSGEPKFRMEKYTINF